MSLVDLRVDLPAYSRSLFLKVDVSNTILQVKEEIHRTCPGQPRPDGQRLIWRGRILTDNETVDSLWKVYSFVFYLPISSQTASISLSLALSILPCILLPGRPPRRKFHKSHSPACPLRLRKPLYHLEIRLSPKWSLPVFHNLQHLD